MYKRQISGSVVLAEKGLDSLSDSCVNGNYHQREIGNDPISGYSHIPLKLQQNHVKHDDHDPRRNLDVYKRQVFRVRSVAAFAIHKFFNERGFVYAHTPLITGSDCEGAGEMFRVTTLDAKNPPLCEDGSVDYAQDFFGKPTSLTVSGQLEAECMAMAFGKVYTFGDVYKRQVYCLPDRHDGQHPTAG